MKYQPRFKPEVYLRFLNSAPRFWLSVEYVEDDDGQIFYHLQGSSNGYDGDNFSFDGDSIEECLDKAILKTKFDQTL